MATYRTDARSKLPLSKSPTYIFSDLNVRDPFVTTSTETMLYDTKVVVQSVWRLITTEEGEIPNFRSYGINVKKYLQYPLNKETIKAIYDHVKSRVEVFEGRAEILKSDVEVNANEGQVFMTFYVRVKSTGEAVKLPTWTVQIAA